MLNKEIFIQFIKFGLVGVSNTLISYATYVVLIFLGTPYLISNGIAFTISVLNSFFWNNKYVFRKDSSEKRIIWKALVKTFLAYGSTGIILSSILLFIFIEKIYLNKYIAPVLVIIITTPINFIINKYWTFKKME